MNNKENKEEIIPSKSTSEKGKIDSFISCASKNWEKEGREIITPETIDFSNHQRIILKGLLLSPLPEDMRKEYWMIGSGAKKIMKDNPSYYHNIIHMYPENIPSPFQKQIELDIERTFPDDPFFKNKIYCQMLSNILLAYSRRSVTVGYFQGFNFIVARILKLIQNEEETFWVFTQLIEQILPINYFCQYAGIMTDCSIMLRLIKIYHNDILSHLDDINSSIILQNVLLKWFLGLYTQNMSEELYLCIWDTMFLQGDLILFKAGLSILRLLRNELLKTTSIEDITPIFEEGIANLTSCKRMIYHLLVMRFDFNSDLINNNRKLILPKVLSNIKSIGIAQNKQNHLITLPKQNICNQDWPFCQKDLLSKYTIYDYCVYKQLIPPNIIDDYISLKTSSHQRNKKRNYSFENKSNKYLKINSLECNEEENKKMKCFTELIIERKVHCCNTKNIAMIGKAKTIEHHSLTLIPNRSNSINYSPSLHDYFHENDCVTIITNIDTSEDKTIEITIDDEPQKKWYEDTEIFYETFC